LERQHRILLVSIFHAVSDFFSNQDDNQTPEDRLEQWINHSFPQKNDRKDPPFWGEVQKKMIEFNAQDSSTSDDFI
jgi:hypothetical protein